MIIEIFYNKDFKLKRIIITIKILIHFLETIIFDKNLQKLQKSKLVLLVKKSRQRKISPG